MENFGANARLDEGGQWSGWFEQNYTLASYTSKNTQNTASLVTHYDDDKIGGCQEFCVNDIFHNLTLPSKSIAN